MKSGEFMDGKRVVKGARAAGGNRPYLDLCDVAHERTIREKRRWQISVATVLLNV